MNWTVVLVSVRSLSYSFSTYARCIVASLLASTYTNVAMAGPTVDVGGNNALSSYVSSKDVSRSTPKTAETQSFTVRSLAPPKIAAANQASSLRSAPTNSAKARRGRSKIITPILNGFAELRNPVALFIAAKNHLLSATHLRMADTVTESDASGRAAIAPINVTFGVAPSYQLTSPSSTAVSRLTNAIDLELHPGIAPDRPLPLLRSSATQLNMRVNDAVSFLWTVDHNESPVIGSEVGMGVGFKVAF